MKIGNEPTSEVRSALRSCRRHLAFSAFFNAFINLLLLAYPIYMIQIFDRVVPARSMESLVALSVGMLLAVLFKSVFQWLRSAMFIRASLRLERRLSDRIFATLLDRSSGGRVDLNAQALRDLDAFRQFATGKGALAAVDAPWAALFVGFLILLDPLVGVVALTCLAVLGLATVVNSLVTKRALTEASRSATGSYMFVDANLRSAEAVNSMGMIEGVVRKWRTIREPAVAIQVAASTHGALFQSLLSAARLLSQGLILAIAAVQIVNASAPISIAFASVLIFQFATRPIEQLVSAWEDYLPVRDGLRRIEALLAAAPVRPPGMTLPRPSGAVTCQNVSFIAPGHDRPIVKAVNFAIPAGGSLGLVGLNGSGKTTLARLLVGNLRPASGHIRIDGADVWTWDRQKLGRYLGYLPQNVSLLSGSVAENIGRFGLFGDTEIIAAARLAGIHDAILRLPHGYDTAIGENGHPLSGGQRQLIGLARAVIGTPSVVVLDEPNSNLDGPGEDALIATVKQLKAQGTTVILITHRPNLVTGLDRVAVLREGALVGFGDTGDVFQRLGRPVLVKTSSAQSAG